MATIKSRHTFSGLLACAFIVAFTLLVFGSPAKATGTGGGTPDVSAEAEANTDVDVDVDAAGGSATLNNNTETKVFGSGASSGNSTSSCQKVRDIRGAFDWLFGFRWDVTDQDCRRLDVADKHYARGDTYFADTLTCSVPAILGAFESVDDCKTQLERNDLIPALKARITLLEQQKADALSERAADAVHCEETKKRISEGFRCPADK